MNKLMRIAVSGMALTLAGTVFASCGIGGGSSSGGTPQLISDEQCMVIDSGFYLGINGGYGKIDETIEGATSSKSTGFTGGVDFGYQFIPYVAAEAGAYYVPNQKYTVNVLGQNIEIKGKDNYFAYLAAKGILPFSNGLNLFAKAGGAWVHHKIEDVFGDSQSYSKIAFLGGVGIGYNITKSVSVALQGLLTTKSGDVPANYLGLVNLTYHF